MTGPTLVNKVLAALLALALVVGGLLAAVEIALAGLDRPSWLIPHDQWNVWLRDHSVNDAVIRAVLVGAVVVGLLLLLPALRRGKPRSLLLPGDTAGVTTRVSRRGVEKSVAMAARRTSGVSGASATAGRRRITVTAHTATRSQPELERHVSVAVQDQLTALGMSGSLTPRVRLTRKDNR